MQMVSDGAICMECQILFSRKNKESISSLLSAELEKREVKFNFFFSFCQEKLRKLNHMLSAYFA